MTVRKYHRIRDPEDHRGRYSHSSQLLLLTAVSRCYYNFVNCCVRLYSHLLASFSFLKHANTVR